MNEQAQHYPSSFAVVKQVNFSIYVLCSFSCLDTHKFKICLLFTNVDKLVWLTYLEMVDVALRPHHQLTGWNGLTTCTAGSAVPK